MSWGGAAVRWGSGSCGHIAPATPVCAVLGGAWSKRSGAADRVACSQPPKAQERGSQRPPPRRSSCRSAPSDQCCPRASAVQWGSCSVFLSVCLSLGTVCRRRGAPAPAASPLVGPLWLSGAWGSGRGTGCWWGVAASFSSVLSSLPTFPAAVPRSVQPLLLAP